MILILIKFCWADYVQNCRTIPFCFFDGHISADDRKKSSYLCQDVVLAHFGCPRVSFSCFRWLLSPFEVICKTDLARSEVSQPGPNLPLHRLATPSTAQNNNPPSNPPSTPIKDQTTEILHPQKDSHSALSPENRGVGKKNSVLQ